MEFMYRLFVAAFSDWLTVHGKSDRQKSNAAVLRKRVNWRSATSFNNFTDKVRRVREGICTIFPSSKFQFGRNDFREFASE